MYGSSEAGPFPGFYQGGGGDPKTDFQEGWILILQIYRVRGPHNKAKSRMKAQEGSSAPLIRPWAHRPFCMFILEVFSIWLRKQKSGQWGNHIRIGREIHIVTSYFMFTYVKYIHLNWICVWWRVVGLNKGEVPSFLECMILNVFWAECTLVKFGFHETRFHPCALFCESVLTLGSTRFIQRVSLVSIPAIEPSTTKV